MISCYRLNIDTLNGYGYVFYDAANVVALELPGFLEHDCTVCTSRSLIHPQGNDPGGHCYVVVSLSSSTAV